MQQARTPAGTAGPDGSTGRPERHAVSMSEIKNRAAAPSLRERRLAVFHEISITSKAKNAAKLRRP